MTSISFVFTTNNTKKNHKNIIYVGSVKCDDRDNERER